MSSQQLNGCGAAPSGAKAATTVEDNLFVIEEAIHQVFAQTEATYSFQRLYDAVHRVMLLHRRGDLLWNSLTTILTRQAGVVSAVVVAAPKEVVIRTWVRCWAHHDLVVQRISGFLLLFNKYYCEALSRPTVHELGVQLLGSRLLQHAELRSRTQDAFLAAVQDARERQNCDTANLFALANLLHSFDLHVAYESLLLVPYLELLLANERGSVQQVLATSSAHEVVLSYNAALSRERELAQRVLGDRAVPRVESTLQNVWLVANVRTIVNEAQLFPLFSEDDQDKLRLIFGAFASIGDADPFLAVAKEFILREVAPPDETCTACVDRLHRLLTRIKLWTREVFREHDRYTRKTELLFRVFGDVLQRTQGAPEALASVLDASIRGSSSTDEEFARMVDRVMELYRHLRDKDLFELQHKNHLARRILNGVMNEERERLFAARLKREACCSVTTKIEGMLADVKTSDDHNTQFREYAAAQGLTLSVDLRVTVLTSGFWPALPSIGLRLPVCLTECQQAFRSYYLARHQGRTLEFCLAQGSCDVRVVTPDGRRYEANVPTAMAPLLLSFPDDRKASAQQVAEQHELNVAETIRGLMALARASATTSALLTADIPAGHGVTASTEFSFNTGFKSRSLKFRLQIPTLRGDGANTMRGVSQTAGGSTLAASQSYGALVSGGASASQLAGESLAAEGGSDRRHKIDAALVRIMKSRRTLDHQSLVAETTRVLRPSFVPAAEDIKKRIEYLLDRDYLARSTEQPGFYTYIV